MKPAEFTHLHLHTEYSLLDGANKIAVLAKEIKARGMSAVAMTDHGNMFGAIDFYKQMKSAGIKPIIGMEGYIHNAEEIDDRSSRQRFHVCLYAKNMVGYKNLMYLSSQAYINGMYYFPRINKKMLFEHSEGLICSSACLQGEVNWHLNLQNQRNVNNGAKGYEGAIAVAKEYKEVFGDDFYLELMRHGIDDQLFIDDQVLKVAKELDIKIVATNDTHYTNQVDADAHEAFMCIGMNKLYDDPNRMRHSVHEFFLKTPEEMAMLYADIPEALEHTMEIANKVEDFEPIVKRPTPPNFKFTPEYAANEGLTINHEDDAPLPDNPTDEQKEKWLSAADKNDAEYFIHCCEVGLLNRLEHVPKERHQEYRDRLKFEIDIINGMKFPGYMLIVWDFVKEAKRIDVAVGPGRGSAAGSLVAFALDITDIDPMKYDLLFERFLNPERVSMPDIDMDFMQARRGEVIDYVVEKYGRNQVAQIITFGSLLAKGVIRDVARVLGMPYAQADAMAKLIPDELGITLNGKEKNGEFIEGAFQKEPKIKELIDSDPAAQRVWTFALALEGLKRNAGMHAAGVVISNEELWHKTPIYKPSGETTFVTQYSLNFLEDVDLIKFDFLGLKTLDVIDNAIKLVKRRYDKEINWHTIDENDPKVYEVIQSGNTVGMFQIESSGMQDLNKRLKPSTFEDLIAVLALYRPGPMESGMLDDFIERKHGRQEIVYVFEALEEILKPTYGVIVYQEQVMQIVQTIGGFSLGGADIVRRAMGKKKVDEMLKYNKEFSAGAQKQGLDYDTASKLFDLIEKFAGYGFNKSHSAAYAMVTFQTAWLKTYYPQEFMAALLTSEKDNTDKIVRYIDESKRMGIDLLPPDVNLSMLEFSATKKDNKDVILFGMGAIKGMGDSATKSILETRKDGLFTDMNDFINRIDTSKVNKRVIESLSKSGGFDQFGISRHALLEQVDTLVTTAAEASRAKKMAVGSLFGDDSEMTTVSLDLIEMTEYELKQILALEKETLGIYVSGHPLDDYKAQLDKLKYTLSSAIDELGDSSTVIIIGKVEEIQKKISKKGNTFGIVNLMDYHGNIEFMLFADMLEELETFDLEEPLAFKVKIQKDDQFTRISARKILTLKEVNKQKTKEVAYVPPPEPEAPLNVYLDLSRSEELLLEFYRIARAHPGNRKLHITLTSKLQNVVIDSKFSIHSNAITQIEALGLKIA
jgi:DNA polymerase III subunit alpha